MQQRYNIMMKHDGNLWLSSPEKIQFEQGNGVNVMAIVNQNVGIGTTNPSHPLHVVGDAKSFNGGLWNILVMLILTQD